MSTTLRDLLPPSCTLLHHEAQALRGTHRYSATQQFALLSAADLRVSGRPYKAKVGGSSPSAPTRHNGQFDAIGTCLIAQDTLTPITSRRCRVAASASRRPRRSEGRVSAEQGRGEAGREQVRRVHADHGEPCGAGEEPRDVRQQSGDHALACDHPDECPSDGRDLMPDGEPEPDTDRGPQHRGGGEGAERRRRPSRSPTTSDVSHSWPIRIGTPIAIATTVAVKRQGHAAGRRSSRPTSRRGPASASGSRARSARSSRTGTRR